MDRVEGDLSLLKQLQDIASNAKEWCQQNMTKQWMAGRVLDGWTTYVEKLEPGWTETWKEKREEYLKGHWMRKPGADSWTLPKSVVGEIKHVGLRADSPDIEEIWNQ